MLAMLRNNILKIIPVLNAKDINTLLGVAKTTRMFVHVHHKELASQEASTKADVNDLLKTLMAVPIKEVITAAKRGNILKDANSYLSFLHKVIGLSASIGEPNNQAPPPTRQKTLTLTR